MLLAMKEMLLAIEFYETAGCYSLFNIQIFQSTQISQSFY